MMLIILFVIYIWLLYELFLLLFFTILIIVFSLFSGIGIRDDSVPKIVFLLTDGEKNKGGDPALISKKMIDKGWDIYAIGFGPRVKQSSLEAYAHDPAKVIKAADINDLLNKIDEVAAATCKPVSSK